MNTKDLTPSNLNLNVLIYGKSGTGKTSWAAHFPKPYIFDFDKGVMSIRGKDVEYDTYSGKDAYSKFERKLLSFETNCPYETIIIDSLTTMQDYCMDRILEINAVKQPRIQDWGALINEIKDVMMRGAKLNKNFIVVAHEQLVQDSQSGVFVVQPLVSGKSLPGQLPLWFDECYRTHVSRTKDGKASYVFQTVGDDKCTAKSRLNVLSNMEEWSKDGKMVNPYELIMGKIKGK
jgi:hypothetical protein